MASSSPHANTEISLRGLLPAASSLLYFNILSAVICSPLLTLCVTLTANSPFYPKSPILPLPLAPPRSMATPAVDEAQPVWCDSASLWYGPVPPSNTLYLLISPLLLRHSTDAPVWKRRESFTLLKNYQCTSMCAPISFHGVRYFVNQLFQLQTVFWLKIFMIKWVIFHLLFSQTVPAFSIPATVVSPA